MLLSSSNMSLKFKISLKRNTIESIPNQEISDTSTERTDIQETDTSLVEKQLQKRVKIDEKQSNLEEKRNKIQPTLEPPSLPDEFKEKISRMGVPISQVSLVIQKVLYDTDLSRNHMRLLIPVKQVRNKDFLTPQQKTELERRDKSNKKVKIPFNLIEPSLEVTKIHLAKWDMTNSSNYVLLNDWIEVAERNKLKSGMVVQLWSFRQDSAPWLALVLVPNEAPQAAMEG